jgi:hypothetical protein
MGNPTIPISIGDRDAYFKKCIKHIHDNHTRLEIDWVNSSYPTLGGVWYGPFTNMIL